MIAPLFVPEDAGQLPNTLRPSQVLYAFSKFGWGHAARCLKIADQVRRLGGHPVVACSQDDFPQAAISPLTVAAIPRYVYRGSELPTEIPREGLASSIEGMDVAALAAYRSQLLSCLLLRLTPSAFYVDSFPFHPDAARAECIGPLATARASGSRTFAGFRGNLSRPLDPVAAREIQDLLDCWIDELFIFVDPQEREVIENHCPFLPRLRCRVTYCGYVTPEPLESDEPMKRSGLVATFGGGIDASGPAALTIKAFRLMCCSQTPIDPELTLVTGERLPEDGLSMLRALADGAPVSIFRSVPDPRLLYRKAQVAISMAGYNTCTDLLSTPCPAIALPRNSGRNREQWHNASKFLDYGVFSAMADPNQLSPVELASLVARVAGEPVRRPAAVSTSGATTAANLLLGL